MHPAPPHRRRRPSLRKPPILPAAIVSVLPALHSPAATVSWAVDSNGIWTTPSNWSINSLTNSGTLTIGPSSTFRSPLPLTNTGLIDLAGGTLLLDQGLAAGSSVRDQLRAAYNYGTWAGPTGITSSLAAADPTHLAAVTYLITGPAYTLRLGTFGDANLDGRIDADDYALIDRALARNLTDAHWTDGDFNYDGVVDQNDYLLIDTSYLQQQGGTPSPFFLSQRESQFGPTYVSQLLTSIPEPSVLACLFAGSPLLTRRARGGSSRGVRG